eukprot:365605-Chlamydomonas_euryale.AAC.11
MYDAFYHHHLHWPTQACRCDESIRQGGGSRRGRTFSQMGDGKARPARTCGHGGPGFGALRASIGDRRGESPARPIVPPAASILRGSEAGSTFKPECGVACGRWHVACRAWRHAHAFLPARTHACTHAHLSAWFNASGCMRVFAAHVHAYEHAYRPIIACGLLACSHACFLACMFGCLDTYMLACLLLCPLPVSILLRRLWHDEDTLICTRWSYNLVGCITSSWCHCAAAPAGGAVQSRHPRATPRVGPTSQRLPRARRQDPATDVITHTHTPPPSRHQPPTTNHQHPHHATNHPPPPTNHPPPPPPPHPAPRCADGARRNLATSTKSAASCSTQSRRTTQSPKN